MYKLALFFCILISVLPAKSESYRYVYRNKSDSSYNCYLECIPSSGNIRGLIVRDFTSLPDTSKTGISKLHKLAAQNDIMTVYTVTSRIYPDLYYDDLGPALLDDIIHEVMKQNSIPKENLFIGGISASGTRALRFAQYCEQGKSKYGTHIKAVFSVDSPLDLERFYISSKRILERHCKNGSIREATLMVKTLDKIFGGPPSKFHRQYADASVYSYTSPKGGNAQYYTKLPIRLYHEPDLDWWMEQRTASYYDMNSVDIAEFVVDLRAQGNKNVELISTSGRGFDHSGNRMPHSWTIVNEPDLMDWILKQIN